VSDAIPREWVEYDQDIVRAGHEVLQQLGMTFKLSRISWTKWSPFLRVSSDECIFTGGALVLPFWMRGKLKPPEWTPLMASSLIYNRRLVWTMSDDAVITFLLVVALGIGGSAFVFATLGGPALLVYLALLFGPFLQHRFSQVRRKLKLRADVEASRLVGASSFLTILEKINSLDMEDVERVKRRRFARYFSSKPSITERILNLRALLEKQAT
jgi:hypothetical protein